MYNLDLALLYCSMRTLALILQIVSLRSSNRVNSNAFFLYAVASYLMAYEYYKKDGQLTSRVKFIIVNSTLFLLIAVMTIK